MPHRSTGPKDGRRTLATAVWSGLVVVIVVLVSPGMLENGLRPLTACVLITFATALSLVAHLLFQSAGHGRRHRHGQLAAGIVTLLPPLLLGTALDGAPSGMMVAYLALLFVSAGAAMLCTRDSVVFPLSTHLNSPKRNSDNVPIGLQRTEEEKTAGNEALLPWEPPREEPPMSLGRETGEAVSQWMTRSLDLDGSERIDGATRVRFAQGQKQATVHLLFCPPLSRQPHVTCQVLDHGSIRLKVGAAQSYGVRLEARRTGPTRVAESVEVGFSAVAAAVHSEAA